jgi:hypothetical protein
MAEKKVLTTVIDSVEDNKGLNKRGWCKYVVYLEGEEGVQKVDVPKDILNDNPDFELEEGMNVTLNKGPFSWILSDKSEIFTGEAPQQKPASQPKRGKPQGGSSKPSGGSSYGNQGRPFSDWDLYQIKERDPQMRMQTLLHISMDIYFKALAENIDPEELMAQVVQGAFNLDDEVHKYIGLEK